MTASLVPILGARGARAESKISAPACCDALIAELQKLKEAQLRHEAWGALLKKRAAELLIRTNAEVCGLPHCGCCGKGGVA